VTAKDIAREIDYLFKSYGYDEFVPPFARYLLVVLLCCSPILLLFILMCFCDDGGYTVQTP